MIDQVVLPRRVLPQPSPLLVNGGDCGACVLSGLLDLSVEKIYKKYHPRGHEAFRYEEMRDALLQGEREGRFDRVIVDHPQWFSQDYWLTWGSPSWRNNLEWFAYLQMAMDAGYYAIACVSFEQSGPFGGGPNHWIMISGVRSGYTEDGVMEQELLVSCSSTRTPAERWVSHTDFLKNWGGFNVFLARPREKKDAKV